MIAGVGSTDARGVLSSLSSSSEVVIAGASSCCGKSRESLEIQPQLANVIRNLADGVGTGTSTGGCIWAGVVWIPDVGGVGGDGGAACGGGDYT